MIRTLLSVFAVTVFLVIAFVLTALAAAHPLAQAGPGKTDPIKTDAAKTDAAKIDTPAAKPVMVVNLNTATVTDLQELPGIGAIVSARIVEYRQKNGPFKKIEELMNVQGIGEKSFLKLRSQVTVASKATPAGQQ
ncbi:MAG: hypothetical protein GEU82_10165 [Luteitalea sp.]|nr:hypothetical protein [Luteitalea sp.]